MSSVEPPEWLRPNLPMMLTGDRAEQIIFTHHVVLGYPLSRQQRIQIGVGIGVTLPLMLLPANHDFRRFANTIASGNVSAMVKRGLHSPWEHHGYVAVGRTADGFSCLYCAQLFDKGVKEHLLYGKAEGGRLRCIEQGLRLFAADMALPEGVMQKCSWQHMHGRCTLRDLHQTMEQTPAGRGELYDVASNNCQDFARQMLRAQSPDQAGLLLPGAVARPPVVRICEDDPTSVQVHDDVHEQWLRVLLPCLETIAIQGPLSQCLTFLDESYVLDVEQQWATQEIKLEALADKPFKMNQIQKLKDIHFPKWSQELAMLYEVIFLSTCYPDLLEHLEFMNDAEIRHGAVTVLTHLRETKLQLMRRLQMAARDLPEAFDVICDLFQGVKHRYDALHFSVGAVVALSNFKYYTIDKRLLEKDRFCGQTGPRTIFIIRQGKGKFIAPLSASRDELQVLLLPGTKLKVESVCYQSMEKGSPFTCADIVEFSVLSYDDEYRNLEYVEHVEHDVEHVEHENWSGCAIS